ncbi:MAG TPA: hypothetical protein DDW50_00820 [Firmicutes bacterium]|jgi:hypothetical protein|nr:hypothetical protein [Bacillota bacterium]
MRQLRNSILGLLVGTLLLIPTAVWGRDNLGTSGSEGIVTIKSIDKLGLRVGGEYGVMDNLALVADLGDHNYLGQPWRTESPLSGPSMFMKMIGIFKPIMRWNSKWI